MTDFQIDWQRQQRTGLAEAVLCEHKSAAQITAILRSADGRPLLLTRLAPEKLAQLPVALASGLDYDPLSGTAMSGAPARQPIPVCIVCAGTSDMPVAREAMRTLHFSGHEPALVCDVGVAGLWRLLERIDFIGSFPIVIAIAGMEGALFSVLGGLVRSTIIAVPTSVGYGVGAGGRAALDSALTSCSPGLVVVNIDNGFGAACAAMKMLTPWPGSVGASPINRAALPYCDAPPG